MMILTVRLALRVSGLKGKTHLADSRDGGVSSRSIASRGQDAGRHWRKRSSKAPI